MTLISRLSQVEEYGDFVALTREYLPERELEILHELTPGAQIAAFAKYFQERYFPLHDMLQCGDAEEYEQLTHSIPLIIMGVSYDFYQEIDSDARGGIQLMTYLVDNPYQEEGGSAALAEACAGIVPQEIIERVPPGGFPHEECRQLHGTKYQGLAHWADQLWSETGNYFLDCSEDDMGGCGGPAYPDWDRETVDELTRLWQQAEQIDREIGNFALWLEESPQDRFEEVLDFMLERRADDAQLPPTRG